MVRNMREDFEKIYEFTNEKIVNEKQRVKEYKKDINQKIKSGVRRDWRKK